jgi:hypothetical protein
MVSLGIGTLVLQEDLSDHWFQVIESRFRTPGLPAGAWVALTLRNRLPPRPEPTRRGHPHPPRRAQRRRSRPPLYKLGTPPKSRHITSQPCAARSYGTESRDKLRHIASHHVTALRRKELRQASAVCGLGIGWRRPPAGGPCSGDARLCDDSDRRECSAACRNRSAARMGAWGTDSESLGTLRQGFPLNGCANFDPS